MSTGFITHAAQKTKTLPLRAQKTSQLATRIKVDLATNLSLTLIQGNTGYLISHNPKKTEGGGVGQVKSPSQTGNTYGPNPQPARSGG